MQGASEQCMQATEMERSPGAAVIECDHPPAVDAPRHFVFVLTGRDTGVAFNAAFGVYRGILL